MVIGGHINCIAHSLYVFQQGLVKCTEVVTIIEHLIFVGSVLLLLANMSLKDPCMQDIDAVYV